MKNIKEFLHIGGKSESARQWEANRTNGSTDSTWVRVHVDHPHVGFSHFSQEKESPWPNSIKVENAPHESVVAAFMGKVLDWDGLSELQKAALKRDAISLSLEALKRLLR